MNTVTKYRHQEKLKKRNREIAISRVVLAMLICYHRLVFYCSYFLCRLNKFYGLLGLKC